MPFSPETLARLEEEDRKVREAFNRGIAQAYLKEYQKAIAEFDKAIQLNSLYAEAYYQRGLAYLRLQPADYISGCEDLYYALELKPDFKGADEAKKLLEGFFGKDYMDKMRELSRRTPPQTAQEKNAATPQYTYFLEPRTPHELAKQSNRRLRMSTADYIAGKRTVEELVLHFYDITKDINPKHYLDPDFLRLLNDTSGLDEQSRGVFLIASYEATKRLAQERLEVETAQQPAQQQKNEITLEGLSIEEMRLARDRQQRAIATHSQQQKKKHWWQR